MTLWDEYHDPSLPIRLFASTETHEVCNQTESQSTLTKIFVHLTFQITADNPIDLFRFNSKENSSF